MKNILKIKDLKLEFDKKIILDNFNLEIKSGETHILMGPNGSGKTTLINAIMGKPDLKIKSGEINLNEQDLLSKKTNEISNLGIFVSFQNPVEVPGLSMRSFLRTALNSKLKIENQKQYSPLEFVEHIYDLAKELDIDTDLILRDLNTNMSGGEKKRSEILQMAVLKPKFALLDEIDSGLDIDALKKISNTIKKIQKKDNTGILIITHFTRILKYISPSHVHIFKNGKIIESGDKRLALKIEKEGYKN